MSFPKTYYMGNDGSGIDITYTKSRKSLWISGWFDHCVGIEGTELSLLDFIKNVGIPVKDLKLVIKQMEVNK